jgi:hypothetical protein
MLRSYSKADYTGSTRHQAQADFIYREGERHGLDLHGKTIKQMSSVELAALADGIKGFEGWKVGTTSVLHSRSPSLPADTASTDALDKHVPASNREGPVVAASHEPIDRNHAAPDAVLKRGAAGRGVREFQESLRDLGYRGADERPLSTDGTFGPNTKYAIESFQRAHHLQVDGIVGKDTRAALKDAQHAPLLSEATNPQHHLYAQILHGIHKLPQGTYRNEQERTNAAVALTISAHVQGLKDIDHVVLGKDGTNLFAVRGPMDDPAHRRVHVDHAQAMSQSIDHGTPALQVSQVQQPMHAMQATQAMHSQIEQRGAVPGISR